MKRILISICILMLIMSMSACNKADTNLVAEEISVNTILAKPDGALQVATIEPFDKPYYSLTGLEEFVVKEVNAYNQKAGADKISVEKIQIVNQNAVMMLSYTGMDQFCAFNEVPGAYFNGGMENISLDLPKSLVNAKGELEASAEIISNEKYKVLVLFEPYDIIVDGTVKYYSDNAKLLEKNKVHGAESGMTVVVYKP